MAVNQVYARNDSLKLRFDLSVRYRFESWAGMNARNYGDDSPGAPGSLYDKILFQRIVSGFTFKPYRRLTLSAHGQDSRAFGWSLRNRLHPDLFKVHATGSPSPYYTMNPNEEFFEIYDAYLEYKELFRSLTLKLGRQKIFYGDYHFSGPGEWGNTGRWTWDALKLSYTKGRNFVDVFAGGTKIHDPANISIPFTRTEFRGGGLYGHLEWLKAMVIEPFYLYKTGGSAPYMNTLNINRHWAGIRIFDDDFYHGVYDLSAAREFGSEEGKTIEAYGIFVKIGYQFHFLPAKPVLNLRESYASGGKKSDNKIHTFDPAYGAGDKFYGWMNITTWSNLDDREIVLELFPFKKKMWAEIKYNRFYIPVPEDVTTLNTLKLISGRHHLGDEADVFIRYQVNKSWQFTGAIGYFMPGDVQPVNNVPPGHALWAAMQVLFILHDH